MTTVVATMYIFGNLVLRDRALTRLRNYNPQPDILWVGLAEPGHVEGKSDPDPFLLVSDSPTFHMICRECGGTAVQEDVGTR
jgi:hypothetical protein